MGTIAFSIIGPTRRVLLCLSVTLAFTACHEHNSAGPESVIPPETPEVPTTGDGSETPPQPAWDGLFYGSITSERDQSAEAVVTADGQIRIHIGNVWDDPAHPNGSAQFIGQFDVIGEQGLGSGVVVGQECVIFPAGRFCGESAPAEITIRKATRELFAGEIRVETSEGLESWTFEMWWSSEVSTNLKYLEGSYQELRAEFAVDDDVVVSVDSTGAVFFQSPVSGCVGNGELTQHPDGPSSVFDAVISIENCGAEFETLNGSYEGLGVHIPGDFYYWPILSLWLSTPGDATVARAITTYSEGQ